MKNRTDRTAFLCVLIVCAAAVVTAQQAQAQTFAGFAPHVEFQVGFRPHSTAIGDLNGDGALDLAVTNQGNSSNRGNTVTVCLADGEGGFAPPQIFAVGNHPSSVAIGDLNGDGALDLAVTNPGSFSSPGNTVSILFGDGTGSFSPPQTILTTAQPWSIAIGDLNGDGTLDLAVTNKGNNSVSIMFGDGTGNFNLQATFLTGIDPVSAAIGDLNGDTFLDLAVVNLGDGSGNNGNTVSILIGDGTGALAPQVTFLAAERPIQGGGGPNFVAMGDLNGDGALDLAITIQGKNVVSILLGDGAGSFAAPQEFAAGDGPVSLVVIDLNRDTFLDLAVANFSSSNVSIYLGDGTGGFSPQQTFLVGLNPRSVAVADMDSDGEFDLVVTNESSDNVSILINQTPNMADFDGDGIVNAADLATLLASWGIAGGGTLVDLDSNGVVNAADLATLLANWG